MTILNTVCFPCLYKFRSSSAQTLSILLVRQRHISNGSFYPSDKKTCVEVNIQKGFKILKLFHIITTFIKFSVNDISPPATAVLF